MTGDHSHKPLSGFQPAHPWVIILLGLKFYLLMIPYVIWGFTLKTTVFVDLAARKLKT